MILGRLRRMSLGTRTAMITLASLVLIQALNTAAFILLPRPPERVFRLDWLAEVSAEAAGLLKLPPDERYDAALKLSDKIGIAVNMHNKSDGTAPPLLPEEPPVTPSGPTAASVLKSMIAERIGPGAGLTILVNEYNYSKQPPMPGLPLPPPFQPPRLQARAAKPVADGEVLPAPFRITLLAANEDRVILLGRPRRTFKWLLMPQVVIGMITITLVALLSAWTAKRSLAPLERLVEATRRMGRERNPAPVETKDLGDFAVVGEALNDMQLQIRTFIDDRTQMIGAMSHDMRTGLTRLRLGAEEMPEGPGKATLVSAIHDMEQMMVATLTFVGDDLKGEPSTEADIAAIVITCCDTLQDLGHTITYEGVDHAYAHCQPVALKRAVMNVAQNAVTYGNEAIVTLEEKADRILIVVRDRGPGIPDHLFPEALRPFRRLETSRSRETGGVGLGLAIARDVMSAHGGTLTLANHPDGGLLATLDLPRASLAKGS